MNIPADIASLPRYHVPALVILDHDRTRSPVSAAMERLLRIAASEPYGIETTGIRTAQEAMEADGMSFDPLAYIKQDLAGRPDAYDLFDRFKKDYLAGEPAELLYPDTAPFETTLRQSPVIPHIVMTAGTNPEWQALKVAASGFSGYTHIIEVGPNLKTPPKGPVIAGWQAGDGTFPVIGTDGNDLPVAVVSARSVFLIDDKAVSLAGLPAGSGGAWIDRTTPGEQRLPSQGSAADLPAGIKVINKLTELSFEHDYAPTADRMAVDRIRKFVPLALYR